MYVRTIAMKVCLRLRKGRISRVHPVLSEITVKTSLLMINNKLLKKRFLSKNFFYSK